MTTPTDVAPAQLPPTIRGFLAAHEAHDTAAALRAFAPTAVVVDDGTSFRGTSRILEFLRGAGAGRWTTELLGAQHVEPARWVVAHRLRGDFPGGVVDLEHRFTLDGESIVELVIAPR